MRPEHSCRHDHHSSSCAVADAGHQRNGCFSGGFFLVIALTFDNPDGYGTLVTGPLPTNTFNDLAFVGYGTNEETEFGWTALDITSGQASVVAATPEPATLLLLGIGLMLVTRKRNVHGRQQTT